MQRLNALAAKLPYACVDRAVEYLIWGRKWPCPEEYFVVCSARKLCCTRKIAICMLTAWNLATRFQGPATASYHAPSLG